MAVCDWILTYKNEIIKIAKIKDKEIIKMKLAMAQMQMTDDINYNLETSLKYCDRAKDSDLLFFPEIQLSPFFPKYEKKDATKYCMTIHSKEVRLLKEKAKQHHYYLSPNVYFEENQKRYDTSLWINPKGELEGRSKMVHIAQAQNFYEQDYYTPSEEGFQVFDTTFGKIGIVICYDRHLLESIRTSTLKGADLIIIPTANTKDEPMEMFEWEIRIQAMQNQVFIAMCNRVGKEDHMEFAGESLIVGPDGNVIFKADDIQQLIECDIDLKKAKKLRESKPYFSTRRPECYL